MGARKRSNLFLSFFLPHLLSLAMEKNSVMRRGEPLLLSCVYVFMRKGEEEIFFLSPSFFFPSYAYLPAPSFSLLHTRGRNLFSLPPSHFPTLLFFLILPSLSCMHAHVCVKGRRRRFLLFLSKVHVMEKKFIAKAFPPFLYPPSVTRKLFLLALLPSSLSIFPLPIT